MSKKDMGLGGKAAIAGVVGSAAVAAALLFVGKKKKDEKQKRFTTPFTDEPPETD